MKTIILPLIFFVSINLQAQKLPLGWRHYGVENGLSAPSVRCVFQDSKKRIWAGTTAGFCFFNGYDFTIPPSVKGLGKLNTWAISEAANGHIWAVGPTGQIQIFEGDSIRPYVFQAKIDSLRKSFLQVIYFTIDSKSNIWLGLIGLGITKIDSKGQVSITRAQSPNFYITTSVEGRTIYASTTSKNSQPVPLQYQNLKKGLEIIENDGTHTVVPLTLPNDAKPNSTHILNLPDNSYLFNNENYLFYIKNGKEVWFRPNSLAVRQLYLTQKGEIVMSCSGEKGGIYFYNNFEDLHYDKPFRQFNGFTTSRLVQDHEGGFWIGLNEQSSGIAYCPDKNWQAIKINKMLSDDSPSALAVASDEQVFISTKQGNVVSYNPKTGVSSVLPPYIWEKFIIGYLFYDSKDKSLWAGNRYLSTYKNGKWKPIFSEFQEGSGSNGGSMKRFTQSAYAPDTLWGCSQRSIFGVRRSTQQVFFKKERMTGGFPTGIFQDSKGVIWVGIDNSLSHLIDTLLVPHKLPEGMPKKFETTHIMELEDSTLVISTNGNGIIYKKGNSWYKIGKEQGLITDIIGKIKQISNSNTVWACTPLGLHKIMFGQNKAKVVERITKAHGLPENSVNDIAFSKSNNGEPVIMYISTDAGVLFTENVLHSDTIIPPQILSIAVNGKPYIVSSDINLNHHQNNITYRLLSFQNRLADKTLFRYRLLPQSHALLGTEAGLGWNESDNRDITLLGLTSDNYTLEVQAQNEDGLWSAPLKVPFIIRPAWYDTWWFRFLLFLTFIAVAYWFYLNRIKSLQKEHSIALQINDLERSALAAQMNPHFIFNCLNSIQLLIQRNDQENAMRYLSHFAKLVRSTLESTRRGKLSVEEETQTLEHYLSLEKLRFKEGLHYDIKIDANIDAYDTELPAMLIQPFVENALKHGLSTEEIAQIDIQFKQLNPHFLSVEIIDNGKGYAENHSNVDNTEGGKTGVGIALSRQRLALLNERVDKNDLKIASLTNDNGEVCGTKVLLIIKVKKT